MISVDEVFMAQMTPQVLEVLDKALALSVKERGLLIDRLVESLDDEPAEEGVEAAWDKEIKRRVDDVRSGRAKTVPGEQVLARLNARLRDAGR
jgi:putative addiction module component (TIGR02574 family)